MTENKSIPLTILRRKQLRARTGLALSTIYDKLNINSPRYDESFPIPLRLGPAAVGWDELEVEKWLASRPRTRTQKTKEEQ